MNPFTSNFFSSATVAGLLGYKLVEHPGVPEKVMGIFINAYGFKTSFYAFTAILGLMLLFSGRQNKSSLEFVTKVGVRVGGIYASTLGLMYGWLGGLFVADFSKSSAPDILGITVLVLGFSVMAAVPFVGWSVSVKSTSALNERINFKQKLLWIQRYLGGFIVLLAISAWLIDLRVLG